LTEITRMTIGRLLEGAFDRGPASRDEVIEEARANGADREAIAALERLSRPNYRELRDLWRELPDVPVGHQLVGTP
jgi:hypothetical protein